MNVEIKFTIQQWIATFIPRCNPCWTPETAALTSRVFDRINLPKSFEKYDTVETEQRSLFRTQPPCSTAIYLKRVNKRRLRWDGSTMTSISEKYVAAFPLGTPFLWNGTWRVILLYPIRTSHIYIILYGLQILLWFGDVESQSSSHCAGHFPKELIVEQRHSVSYSNNAPASLNLLIIRKGIAVRYPSRICEAGLHVNTVPSTDAFLFRFKMHESTTAYSHWRLVHATYIVTGTEAVWPCIHS